MYSNLNMKEKHYRSFIYTTQWTSPNLLRYREFFRENFFMERGMQQVI